MKGVAFLFPGNLSVRVGMLAGLAGGNPALLEPLGEASDRAKADLWLLARQGPEEALRQDPLASLAVVAVDVAIYRLLEEMGIAPVALAGYGPGYHAAVVASGVLPLATALDIAAEEQRIGWEIVGDREFGLVEVQGLRPEEIEDVLGDLVRGEAVCIAAQDGPARMTLAGERAALDSALDRLSAHTDRIVPLPRSLPRHTPAMLPVAEGLNAAFGRLAADDPRTPIYSHFDGSIVLRGWQAKELMMKQMSYPLRWDQCVRGLVANGIDTFVEVGPGTRLSELVRAIAPAANVFDTDRSESIDRLRESFSAWNF